MLVGVEDVAAVPEDEVGDGGDQSFLVGTTDEEDGAGSHGFIECSLRDLEDLRRPYGTFVACALY